MGLRPTAVEAVRLIHFVEEADGTFHAFGTTQKEVALRL
jgi:hypothetical protein